MMLLFTTIYDTWHYTGDLFYEIWLRLESSYKSPILCNIICILSGRYLLNINICIYNHST